MPHECTTCGRVFADGSKEMLSGCPDCGGNKFQFKPAAATEREDTTPTTGTEQATPNTADPNETSSDRDTTHSNAPEPRRDLSEGSKEWPDHGYGSAANSGTTAPESADADTSAPESADADTSAPDGSGSDAPDGSGSDAPVTDSTTTDPDAAATDPDAATDSVDAEAMDAASGPTADRSAEDPAQANARSDVVSPDEIAAATPEETDGTATPDGPGSPATHDGDRPADTGDRAAEPTPDDRPGLEDLREELNEQFESIRIVAPGEYELNLMELYDRTEYIISLQEDGRYIIEVPDTWDTTPDPDET